MRYLFLVYLVLVSACTYPYYSQSYLERNYEIKISGLKYSELTNKNIEPCVDEKRDCDGYFLIKDGKIAVYYKLSEDGYVLRYWGENT